jgi:hypothetical protein
MDWSTVGSSTIEDDVEKFLWATDIASQITSGEVTDVRELSATLLGVGGSFVSSHSIDLRVWQLLHDIEVLFDGIDAPKVAKTIDLFFTSLEHHTAEADVVSCACELLAMLASKGLLKQHVDSRLLTAIIEELSAHTHSNQVKRASLGILMTLAVQGHDLYSEGLLRPLLPVLMDILLVNRSEHDIVEAAAIVVFAAMKHNWCSVKVYSNSLTVSISNVLSFSPLPPLQALVPCILMLGKILEGDYDDGHLLEAIPCLLENGQAIVRALKLALEHGREQEGENDGTTLQDETAEALCATFNCINKAISDVDILVLGMDEVDMRGALEALRDAAYCLFPYPQAPALRALFPTDRLSIKHSEELAKALVQFRQASGLVLGAHAGEDEHDRQLVREKKDDSIEAKLNALIDKLDDKGSVDVVIQKAEEE